MYHDEVDWVNDFTVWVLYVASLDFAAPTLWLSQRYKKIEILWMVVLDAVLRVRGPSHASFFILRGFWNSSRAIRFPLPFVADAVPLLWEVHTDVHVIIDGAKVIIGHQKGPVFCSRIKWFIVIFHLKCKLVYVFLNFLTLIVPSTCPLAPSPRIPDSDKAYFFPWVMLVVNLESFQNTVSMRVLDASIHFINNDARLNPYSGVLVTFRASHEASFLDSQFHVLPKRILVAKSTVREAAGFIMQVELLSDETCHLGQRIIDTTGDESFIAVVEFGIGFLNERDPGLPHVLAS